MEEEVRRSGRKRKPNTKYLNEASGEDEFEATAGEDDSVASEFEEIEAEQDQDSDLEDDVLVASEEDGSLREFDLIAEAEASSEHLALEDQERQKLTARRAKNARRDATNASASKSGSNGIQATDGRDGGPRTRGLQLFTSVMSKAHTLSEIVGNDPDLFEKLRVDRDKFAKAITLPLRHDVVTGQLIISYPQIKDQKIQESERSAFSTWYQQKGGRAIMAEAQSIRNPTSEDIANYMDPPRTTHRVLLGPYVRQKMFNIAVQDSLSLTEAWQLAMAELEPHNATGVDRPGWILNLGGRIVHMEWAPNHDGEFQYLAIAVGRELPQSIVKISPFEPTTPYPASLQIWAFKKKVTNGDSTIDANHKPKLVQVLCADWGAVRRFSWCPASFRDTTDDKSIGILALVSSDGCVRVIDVQMKSDIHDAFVKYEAAAFTSRPPDTICTCVVWISANQLAAGCADGHVAIWDVGQCLRTLASNDQPPEDKVPFWYHRLHTTYVLSIIAHQPYPCQYIVTNSVDGKTRLTSLRNPNADTVYGLRERHLMPSLAYSPHILGHYEVDDNNVIRARPMRIFPLSRVVGKVPTQITCLDAGKCHPTLLCGCSDGHVIINNPIRRLLIRRVRAEKIAAWQQKWFQHEFVPTSRMQEMDIQSVLERDRQESNFPIPRGGISRFLEGFNLERIKLNKATKIKGLENADLEVAEAEQGLEIAPVPEADIDLDSELEDAIQTPKKRRKRPADPKPTQAILEEQQHIALFEEETGVTCLCWNPNPETGGWAAAGMANGLLRVEDLAV